MSGYLRRVLARQVVRNLKRSQQFDTARLTEIQRSLTRALTLNPVKKKTRTEHLSQFVLSWKSKECDDGTVVSDIHVSDILESLKAQEPEDIPINITQDENSSLHLQLTPDVLAKHVLPHIIETNEKFGYHGEFLFRGDKSSTPETIVVEFSSPNIAKPFHMGHLRSTIIGNVLANLYEKLGYRVVRLNYLGDWGTQFGVLSVGFDRYGNLNELNRNAMEHLLEVYVKVNKDITLEESEGTTQEHQGATFQLAREAFRKMEEGDEALLGLWRTFCDLTVKELKQVYERLGVKFTEYHGESMYASQCDELIQRLKQADLLQISEDGKRIVEVDTIKSPMNKAVIQKSDGTSLYITRDVLALLDRFKRYNFKKIHYIVENGQHQHFRHLLGLLRLLEPWSNRLEDDIHVSFGRVIGMQTRKGNIVFLKDILDEAKNQMKEKILAKKTTKISENIEEVADVLGVSAVVVQDLSQRRKRDYNFSWERTVNLKSDSGVFLQYTHARLCNLEMNSEVTLEADFDPQHLVSAEVHLLMIHLARYEDAVESAFTTLEPFHIVHYLFTLCHFVNSCYRNLTVKGQEKDVAQARLHLFHASRITLANGMRLLGLNPLKEM